MKQIFILSFIISCIMNTLLGQNSNCTPPILTISKYECYDDSFKLYIYTDAQNISSSFGNINDTSFINYSYGNSNIVSNLYKTLILPKNFNVEIIAQKDSNCKSTLKFKTPNSNCSDVEVFLPEISIGNGICEGNTWKVSLSINHWDSNAILDTSNTGTKVGNSYINIPNGQDFIVSITNKRRSNLTTIIEIKYPLSCSDNNLCNDLPISFSGDICTHNGYLYKLNLVKSSLFPFESNLGSITNDNISEIPNTNNLQLKTIRNQCQDTLKFNYYRFDTCSNYGNSDSYYGNIFNTYFDRYYDKDKNCSKSSEEGVLSFDKLPKELIEKDYYIKIFKLSKNYPKIQSITKISSLVYSDISMKKELGRYKIIIDNNDNELDTLANYPKCWSGQDYYYNVITVNDNFKIVDANNQEIFYFNTPKVCMQYTCDSFNVKNDSFLSNLITEEFNVATNDVSLNDALFQIESNTLNGTISIDSFTGVVTYIRNQNQRGAGIDSFRYSVKNQVTDVSKSASVYIKLNEVFIVNPDYGYTDSKKTIVMDLKQNDILPPKVVFHIKDQARQGSLEINSNTGLAFYTPLDSSFEGTDTFSYTVKNSINGTSKSNWVFIDIFNLDGVGVGVESANFDSFNVKKDSIFAKNKSTINPISNKWYLKKGNTILSPNPIATSFDLNTKIPTSIKEFDSLCLEVSDNINSVPLFVCKHLKFVASSITDMNVTKYDISVYPNPSQGFVNVSFKGIPYNTGATLKIFNVEGKEVFNTIIKNTAQDFKLVLDALGAGTFILQTEINGEINLKKIVISK